MAASARIEALMTDYAVWHTARGNLACHAVGVPVIIASLASLLRLVPLATVAGFSITVSEAVGVTLIVGYVVFAGRLGVATALGVAALVVAGRAIPPIAAAGLFVAGSILQLLGHYRFEHQPPAFTRNLRHVLIAPLWLIAKLSPRLR